MKVKERVFDVLDKSITFDLPKARRSVRIGRGDKAITLLELYAGFDIETTNVRQIDGWAAYAYHMQLSLYSDKEHYVYLFRRWEVVEWFFDHIANVYKLGADQHILVWVANLSFEFQFMRHRFQWDAGEYDFFAKEERQPLKATYRGIEFREALAISGGSLAQLAEDYCTTKKLVTYDAHGNKISDLDYSIERSSKTKLTDQERAYCINDVVILAEFSQYLFESYIRSKRKVPMTKTSMLIEEYREDFSALCKDLDIKYHRSESYTEQAWREYLLKCYPDIDTYALWFKYLFRGGYVHANALYVGSSGIKCRMRDITSSYPGRMNLAYYPRTPFKKVPFKEEYLKSKCCIIRAQFDHIHATTPHSIESRNKIINVVGGKFDNGRLVKADLVEVLLTEMDYDIYRKFYAWQGSPTITECYISERGKLPPYLLHVLNKSYRDKQHLKATGQKNTQKYAITKAKVNTNYGATVKRIRLDKITINERGDWCRDLVREQFETERAKTLLLPQWGIWVTSAARYELLSMLYKLTKAGVQVVYMDTDSIKYIPSHRAEQIFKHYNNMIRRRLHNRKLRDPYFSDLSMYDIEVSGNPALLFKTLGAKRYIYQEDDIIHATVSGMPKASIYNLGDDPKKIFANFNLTGYNLPPAESGKITTKYRDAPHEALVGIGRDREKMSELTSVALYEIPFSLTLKGEFITYVQDKQREERLTI